MNFKTLAVGVFAVAAFAGSAEAFTNYQAQGVCQYWVTKVERNSSILQGWLVRHTHGLSGNKLGPGYPQYAKLYHYNKGNGYRTMLVNVSWALRDSAYVIAKLPSMHPDDKAARCRAAGEQANTSVIRLWKFLNPGNKIP